MKKYLFLLLPLFLLGVGPCKPVQVMSKTDFSNAGVDSIKGVDASSSTITTTVNINVNVEGKVLDNYDKPIVQVHVEKPEITLYRNNSKSSWVNWLIVVLAFFNLVWVIIHVRKSR